MGKKLIIPWLDFYGTPNRHVIINPYAFASGGGGGGGSPTLIAHTINGSNGATQTTANIDTTGANFIAVVLSSYDGSAPTLSDSNSNSWSYLTLYHGDAASTTIAYCYAPTVGSSHNFTATGVHISLSVSAWSGMASSPFDVENGHVGTIFGTNTTLSTGSVTPGQANSLLITGFMGESVGTPTIDSGFTITDAANLPGGGCDAGMAYKILTSSSATNPSWSFSSNPPLAAVAIAAFKF